MTEKLKLTKKARKLLSFLKHGSKNMKNKLKELANVRKEAED